MAEKGHSTLRSFLLYPNESHSNPNLATSVRSEPDIVLTYPFLPTNGERVWVPANSPETAVSALGAVVLENPYARNAYSVANTAGLVGQQIGNIREKYLGGLRSVNAAWEKGGKAMTVDMARELVEHRERLREEVRALNYVGGMFASARDVLKSGASGSFQERKAAYAEKNVIAQENRLAAGQIERVITGAVTDNPKVTRFAQVAGRLGKALSVGATVVTALEVPYGAYRLYNAETLKEKQDAVGLLSGATVNAAGAALCIGLGIGTAGLGVLACAVLPVVAGIYADKAARQLMSSMN